LVIGLLRKLGMDLQCLPGLQGGLARPGMKMEEVKMASRL
jgi:hypothetical protein